MDRWPVQPPIEVVDARMVRYERKDLHPIAHTASAAVLLEMATVAPHHLVVLFIDGEYVDTLVAIAPEAGDERWMRAVLLFRAGRREEAIRDADWLVLNRPEGGNLNQVDELRWLLERLDK